LAGAAGFGIVAVLAGAWFSGGGSLAGSIPSPRSAAARHEERSAQATRRWPAWALACLVVAGGSGRACLANGGRRRWPSEGAFFSSSAGFRAACSRRPPPRSASARRAGTSWGRPLAARRGPVWGVRSHRNAVTVAALATAIAHDRRTDGDDSFLPGKCERLDRARHRRRSLHRAGRETKSSASRPSSLRSRSRGLRARPDVQSVDTFRELPVSLAGTPPRPALLAVVEGRYRGNLQFEGGRRCGANGARLCRRSGGRDGKFSRANIACRPGTVCPCSRRTGRSSFPVGGACMRTTRATRGRDLHGARLVSRAIGPMPARCRSPCISRRGRTARRWPRRSTRSSIARANM